MATPDPSHRSTPTHRLFRFSIRGLLLLIALVSLSIVTIQYFWSRRSVSALIPLSLVDASIYEPFVADIVEESETIRSLRIDVSTNSLFVTAQARNIEVAKREVKELVLDPSSIFAATSLELSLEETREILGGS